MRNPQIDTDLPEIKIIHRPNKPAPGDYTRHQLNTTLSNAQVSSHDQRTVKHFLYPVTKYETPNTQSIAGNVTDSNRMQAWYTRWPVSNNDEGCNHRMGQKLRNLEAQNRDWFAGRPTYLFHKTAWHSGC